METKKLTHWFNWKEWKSVVDDAYNQENDSNAYRRAFSTILAWEARDPNLPSAIICLKELLMGRLSQLNRTSNSIDQMFSYQASLSMNIVRFVNFITEPYQKNIYAKPVKNIAFEIGLPYWIVNLRHNATHFNLPSIEILEKALDFLFDWIEERYVSKYKETAVEQSLLNDIKLSIQNLFVDYMNSQYKTTLMRNKKTTTDLSEELIIKLEELTSHFRNETFEILLDDGYMIPTKDQLTAFGIVPEEFLEQENLYIPKSFLNIWMTFLAYLNENNLIGLFFQNLINTYKQEAERSLSFSTEYLRKKFLLSWIICLLKFNSFKNEKSKNSKFYFEFSFKQVLLDVLGSKANHLGTHFLTEISKIASFDSEINSTNLEKLKTVLNFVSMANTVEINQYSLDDENNQMESDDQSVYNMDLFENKNKTDSFISMQTSAVQSKQIKSDWQLIDDLDWNHENLKIGMIEGQSYLTLNLDLNQFLENNHNHLTNTSMQNELNSSINDKRTSKQTQNTFADLLNKDNIEFYKKSLMVNYWEFSS